MIAELKETIELARALDHVITFNEHHCATIPVRRASERIREGIIEALRGALAELGGAWPATDETEIARFEEALEKGEIPKQADGQLPGFIPHLLNEQLTNLEEKIALKKKPAVAA